MSPLSLLCESPAPRTPSDRPAPPGAQRGQGHQAQPPSPQHPARCALPVTPATASRAEAPGKDKTVARGGRANGLQPPQATRLPPPPPQEASRGLPGHPRRERGTPASQRTMPDSKQAPLCALREGDRAWHCSPTLLCCRTPAPSQPRSTCPWGTDAPRAAGLPRSRAAAAPVGSRISSDPPKENKRGPAGE